MAFTPRELKINDAEHNGFSALKHRLENFRVDFVALGDSNQLQSGNGWDQGMQYALSEKYPMYATSLISMNENNSNGNGVGYYYSFNAAQSEFGADTGAPSELDKFWRTEEVGVAPHGYMYFDSGTYNGNTGITLSELCPFNYDSDISAHYYYGTFDTGAGIFRPQIRLNQSPWTTYGISTVNTNTGAVGFASTELRLSSGDRKSQGSLGVLVNGAGTNLTGPFMGYWVRLVDNDARNGFSYSTLQARGGKSSRTMAEVMLAMPDESLTSYFSIIRENQGAVKTVVVCINEGLNDRNETDTSVGTYKVIDGDSAAAFEDNIMAIYERIVGIWDLNGWDKRELFWVMMPSHPVSSPDAADLVSYRDSLEKYTAHIDNFKVVNIADLITSNEMLELGFYKSGGSDRNHLESEGYNNISTLIVDDILK